MPRFEDLEVWKRSARLSADLYRYFQNSKDYGFRDQITRSGLSVPSNIAEGHERDTAKDRGKFLTYAKGSCGELRTQIYIGMEAAYIDKDQGTYSIKETRELPKMLHALIKYLQTLLNRMGWQAQIPLKEGIANTYAKYRRRAKGLDVNQDSQDV